MRFTHPTFRLGVVQEIKGSLYVKRRVAASVLAVVKNAKDAMTGPTNEFDKVRRSSDATVHPVRRGGSFFVPEMSAYSRLACEDTVGCLNKSPPAGNGLFTDLSSWCASTWKCEDLVETYNMNSATRYRCDEMFAWFYIRYRYRRQEHDWTCDTHIPSSVQSHSREPGII